MSAQQKEITVEESQDLLADFMKLNPPLASLSVRKVHPYTQIEVQFCNDWITFDVWGKWIAKDEFKVDAIKLYGVDVRSERVHDLVLEYVEREDGLAG